MDETRGVNEPPPLDPYRVLRLHPSAPRELIEEAYWLHVERVRRGALQADEVELNELNEAYRILANEDLRHAFGDQHGYERPRKLQARITTRGIGPIGVTKVTCDFADYYHLLRVDRCADGDVIDLAYAILYREASSNKREDVHLRGMLTTAHGILSNPQRRARYDAELAPLPLAGTIASPQLRSDSQGTHKSQQQIRKNANDADLAGAKADAPPMRSTPDEPDVPQSNAAADVEVAMTASERGDMLRDEEKVASAPQDTALAPAFAPIGSNGNHERDDLDGLPVAKEAHLADNPEPIEADTGGTEESTTRIERTRPAGLLGRLLERGQSIRTNHAQWADPREGLDEDVRLSGLRELSLSVSDSPNPDAQEAHGVESAVAELLLLDNAGSSELIRIGRRAITLGASADCDVQLHSDDGTVAAVHARMWPYLDSFVLLEVDGATTLVGGRRLKASFVVLEDGDELQIGTSRLRFRQALVL